MTGEDPRDVGLSACASGARVLVFKADGARLEGHIERLLHGGFEIVAKVDGGFQRIIVWWADVESMAEFDEIETLPEEYEMGDADLQELSRRLRLEALHEGSKSLAERIITKTERES